jgi:hypothetical protein
MWASNLVPEPRVESGEKNGVTLARKGLRKTGGREGGTSHERDSVMPA